MARTSIFAVLALLVCGLGTANAGWHHRHYYYPAYPAYPVAAAYYPMAPAAYPVPVAPTQTTIDEGQLARLLEQSLGAARARNLAASADNGPSPEMIQVQQDLAGLKAQLNNVEAKVQEHDTQIRSIQEELKAIKAALMK